MRAVLADLVVESEAHTALAFRVGRACDESLRGDAAAGRFARIAMPVAKYWICKRAAAFVHEALECHGGNGFVEEQAARAPPAVADWFCASRLAGDGGRAFGTLPAGPDLRAIVERAALTP